MQINYQKLGVKIRAARKDKGLTQENVAEATGLSVPHMSHIERGTTKLGLPTLIAICNVLSVTPDSLLCDSLEKSRPEFERELSNILADCTETELRIITDTAAAIKQSLRARLPDASKE